MNTPQEIIETLNEHLAVCQELLAAAQREGQCLRRPDKPPLFEFYQIKKNLLPRLNETLDRLRKHRVNWQRLSLDERARHGQVGTLLRRNQDLTMKIIVLDRENEQALLRRGLVPPRQLPPVNRQRPHFVADLYRRQGFA
jgi:DNA-directed RNA polymerase subunit H (RpoH/RPB5)